MVTRFRRSATNRLNLWLNGTPVARWDIRNGEHSLTYFDDWLADEQCRPISLSLPITAGNAPYRGDVVRNYFDNLLPDSDAIRRRMADHFGTGGVAAHELLAAVGRDCVGALQLLPQDGQPTHLFSIRSEALGQADIAALLRRAVSDRPLGQREELADLRLSIAGAQEKTALLQQDGKWRLPLASTPTTHILKLPLGLVGAMQADMRTSVENEWLCSKMIAAFGLPVAHCDMAQFEEQKVLVVSRFDRRLADDGSWIIRLPQEDFCQATGTSATRKYQADGGPGISDVMQILAGSTRAIEDRTHFFKAQVVFWLLAATDGHAKNFSIVHLPQRQFRATPLYDVLSAHPVIGNKANMIAAQRARLAMAVRGKSNHYVLRDIRRNHWLAHAAQTGLGEALAQQIIDESIAQVPAVIETAGAQLPPGFPADLFEAIARGLRDQAALLSRT
ncbi:type II toxin-antitoxin system HipA family toxin [Herbaspirillum sp. alder98]|uniref:type II toxin-antitoxin system HipA family toxin n=1 Tax=Herbaspirillum sp. alder98 TaxID=2913096 RepID=UPI001CD86E85|nr:type II toxin-antitoxin system HipA family toxin [Herbaspirillum sp. alder98]MCA1323145.1 type II toxin-antitoxin system HipA family toxin [Herbaspirillum sp. alder98]